MHYIIAAVMSDCARLFKTGYHSAHSTWVPDINLAERHEYKDLVRSFARSDSLARDVFATYVLENDGHKVVGVFQKGVETPWMENLHWEDLNK